MGDTCRGCKEHKECQSDLEEVGKQMSDKGLVASKHTSYRANPTRTWRENSISNKFMKNMILIPMNKGYNKNNSHLKYK